MQQPTAGGTPPADDTAFGPRGYLPERAARRARKIVLRERMGAQWPLGALAAALLVIAGGTAFLLTRGGPPGPPFAPAGPLEQVDPRAAAVIEAAGEEVLVVRAGGVLRAFLAPDAAVTYCRASDRLEASDGSVWARTGRRTGGPQASLAPVPVVAHDGVLYVAPSAAREPLPPADGERPAC